MIRRLMTLIVVSAFACAVDAFAGDDASQPSSYSANTWFLGPHLNKYRNADKLERINALADLELSGDEFVVRAGIDILDLKKVPGFLRLFGRALKAEPVETTTRSLVNLGTAAIAVIGTAEGTDALGWTDFDILGKDDDRDRPASSAAVPESEAISVEVNDNVGEVTLVIQQSGGNANTEGTVQ